MPNAASAWIEGFINAHAKLCSSLPGQPKGDMIVSNSGKIQNVGVRMTQNCLTNPTWSADRVAQQAANVLFQENLANQKFECWSVIFSNKTGFALYYPSQSNTWHVAMRLSPRNRR
eukprot:1253392-Amphidinium_carterae.1